MKNLITKLLIILAIVVGFTSCKKEPPPMPENPQTSIYKPNNVNPIGQTWELRSGRIFVENNDNGSTFYYDHFGPNKNSSNLDIFSASSVPFDIISKGLTTWEFTSYNEFVLDGGSTYNYSVNTHGFFNVYGLENGSSRSIEILVSTNDYIEVRVYESVGNDGTYNYSFYSQLIFVRAGFTSTVTPSNVPVGYSYNGVVGNSNNNGTSLVNTKWIVTKFIQNFVSTYPGDTLTFVSSTQYTINGSTPRTYNLSGIVGNNMKSLSLNSFTTLGGDWSGQVQSTFITDGVVNNANFTNVMNSVPDARLWMVKIQ